MATECGMPYVVAGVVGLFAGVALAVALLWRYLGD